MRLILVSLFLISHIIASEINWLNNYHMARQQAKKENKNIFLYITQRDNPYCEVMDEDTFKNTKIIKYIENDYLAVKIFIEDNRLPSGLGKIQYAPTVYFLKANGKNIIRRVVGEITIKKMQNYLEQIEKLEE